VIQPTVEDDNTGSGSNASGSGSSSTSGTTGTSITIIPTDTTIEEEGSTTPTSGSPFGGTGGSTAAIAFGNSEDEWYDPLTFDQFVAVAIAGTMIVFVLFLMLVMIYHHQQRKRNMTTDQVDTEDDLISRSQNDTNLVQYDMPSGELSKTGFEKEVPPQNSVFMEEKRARGPEALTKKRQDPETAKSRNSKGTESLFQRAVHRP
jgi:hypothetical protein